jgi:hypothetical protein
MRFESLDEFLNHNESHIKIIDKSKYEEKNYEKTKSWIEKFVNFCETLKTEPLIQNSVSKYFGDYCPVCKILKSIVKDSEQIFNESVFANNRQLIRAKDLENSFKAHLFKHLSYEPIFECTLCKVKKIEPIFSCTEVKDLARSHVIGCHESDIKDLTLLDTIDPFFDNNKMNIKVLDHFINDIINRFLIKNI